MSAPDSPKQPSFPETAPAAQSVTPHPTPPEGLQVVSRDPSSSEETIAGIMQAAAPLVQMFIESQTEAAKMQAEAAKMQIEAQQIAVQRETEARVKAAEAMGLFLVQLIKLGVWVLVAGFIILVVAMLTDKEQFVLTILKYAGSLIAGAGIVEAIRKVLHK